MRLVEGLFDLPQKRKKNRIHLDSAYFTEN